MSISFWELENKTGQRTALKRLQQRTSVVVELKGWSRRSFLPRQVEHDLDSLCLGSVSSALESRYDLITPAKAKTVRDHWLHIYPAFLQHLDCRGILHDTTTSQTPCLRTSKYQQQDYSSEPKAVREHACHIDPAVLIYLSCHGILHATYAYLA